MRDRTIRGTVKPYWRKAQGLWFARGWVPERQADGRIARQRIERGPGSPTRSACQALCDQLNRLYEERASAVKRPLTFSRAVTNYITSGGEARFLTDAIMTRIGLRQCSDIDDTVMSDLSRELFPNATPATVNRQLYTPVIAVLSMAAKGGHCPHPTLTRPRGHDKAPPITIPAEDWFALIEPHCSRKLWALLLVLTLHGRRPKELLLLPPAAYDRGAGTLSIPDSKTGTPVLVRLAPICIEAIDDMLAAKHADRRANKDVLFGYLYSCRRNVLRDIRKAATAADATYHGAHAIGRHSFATRLLNDGYSVKHVMDAAGWSSERMLMRRYGHLAKSEVDDAVRKVGIKWGDRLKAASGADIISPDFAKKKRSGNEG